MPEPLLIGKGNNGVYLLPALANRHGLIAGATGTGKTVHASAHGDIDSSGIATFVEALKHMKTYGGRLRLFGLPGGVKEIFGFSKLDKVFDICGDIEDALGT